MSAKSNISAFRMWNINHHTWIDKQYLPSKLHTLIWYR